MVLGVKRALLFALVLTILIAHASNVLAIYEKYTIQDNNVAKMSDVANLFTIIVQVDDANNFKEAYLDLLANLYQNNYTAINASISHIKAIDAYNVSKWNNNQLEYSEFDLTDLSQSDKFMNFFLLPAGTSDQRKYAVLGELTVDPTIFGKTVTYDPFFKLKNGILTNYLYNEEQQEKHVFSSVQYYTAFTNVFVFKNTEIRFLYNTYTCFNGDPQGEKVRIQFFSKKYGEKTVTQYSSDLIFNNGNCNAKKEHEITVFTSNDYILLATDAGNFIYDVSTMTKHSISVAGEIIAFAEADKNTLYVVTKNTNTFTLYSISTATYTATKVKEITAQSDFVNKVSTEELLQKATAFDTIDIYTVHSVYLPYTQELILLDASGGVLYVNFMNNVIMSYKIQNEALSSLITNTTSWGLTAINPASAGLYIINDAGTTYDVKTYTIINNLRNIEIANAYDVNSTNVNFDMNSLAKKVIVDLVNKQKMNIPQIPKTTAYITVYDRYNNNVTKNYEISLKTAWDGVQLNGTEIIIPSAFFGEDVPITLHLTKKSDPTFQFDYKLTITADGGIKFITISTAQAEAIKNEISQLESNVTKSVNNVKYDYKFKFFSADNKLIRTKLFIVINGTKYELDYGNDGYYHFRTNITLSDVKTFKIVDANGKTIKELDGKNFVAGDYVAYNILAFDTSKYFVVNYRLDVYVDDANALSRIKLENYLSGYFVINEKLQLTTLSINEMKKLGAQIYTSTLRDIDNEKHEIITITMLIPREEIEQGTYTITTKAEYETFNFKKIELAKTTAKFTYTTNAKTTDVEATINITTANNEQVQKTTLVSKVLNSTSLLSLLILIIISVAVAMLTRSEKVTLFIAITTFVILALAGLISEAILVVTLILASLVLALRLSGQLTAGGGD